MKRRKPRLDRDTLGTALRAVLTAAFGEEQHFDAQLKKLEALK